jgi:hypothetical protein
MNYEELNTLLDKADEHNNTGNYNEAKRLAKEALTSLQSPAGDGAPFVKGLKMEKPAANKTT